MPDYKGNNNGMADDFGDMSGTSMAAPYVAGASVLIRQAMQFVGMTNITQDMIYNHMMATADTFFDSATNQSTSGSTWRGDRRTDADRRLRLDGRRRRTTSARSSAPRRSNGKIGKLTDVDYFKFTAGVQRHVTFDAACSAGMTPRGRCLAPRPLAGGTAGRVVQRRRRDRRTRSRSVVAERHGQLHAQLDAGVGVYVTDWGAVGFNQMNDVNVARRALVSRSGDADGHADGAGRVQRGERQRQRRLLQREHAATSPPGTTSGGRRGPT